MSEEIPRCPHCGAIRGGTAAALDALYAEVARLSELAERQGADGEHEEQARALAESRAREAELRREIRLLQETVARLRGGFVMLRT